MKFAVIVFPGSNCDLDLYHAVSEVTQASVELVRHDQTSLDGYAGVLLPGGFSYGDYLRCGAIARFAPIMSEVERFAREGRPVFGTCNGFQILTESGLLPGILLRNKSLHFTCKTVPLKVENNATPFTSHYGKDEIIHLPVAHGEGNYHADPDTLAALQDGGQIAFTYAGENFNGSTAAIAGITNRRGNVLGMMPHPERATSQLLGGSDGRKLFASLFEHVLATA